jgi:hypothetical protein
MESICGPEVISYKHVNAQKAALNARASTSISFLSLDIGGHPQETPTPLHQGHAKSLLRARWPC